MNNTEAAKIFKAFSDERCLEILEELRKVCITTDEWGDDGTVYPIASYEDILKRETK